MLEPRPQALLRSRNIVEVSDLKLGVTTLAATVSVGVVLSSDLNRNLADLMEEADRALYRSKANGRNRVEHLSGLRP